MASWRLAHCPYQPPQPCLGSAQKRGWPRSCASRATPPPAAGPLEAASARASLRAHASPGSSPAPFLAPPAALNGPADSLASGAAAPRPRPSPRAGPGPGQAAPFAAALVACPDLPSTLDLLTAVVASGAASPPPAAAPHLRAHPHDLPFVYKHLGARWQASPQGPADAALLADSLRAAYALTALHLSSLAPLQAAKSLIHLSHLPGASPQMLQQLVNAIHLPKSSPSPSSQAPYASASGTAALAAPGGAPPAGCLSQVVHALALHNVRPSDAWLGSAMVELQRALPQLSGRQLSQLLWALVRLGVKPTTPWLAQYEGALLPWLALPWSSGAGSSSSSSGTPAGPLGAGAAPAGAATQPQQAAPWPAGAEGAGSDPVGGGGAGAPSCEDVVQVAWALAEAGYQPTPACRHALLAASRERLGSCAPHLLAQLAGAVIRLRWRPDQQWTLRFVEATGPLLHQMRAPDVPQVLACLCAVGAAPGQPWLLACLRATLEQMCQFSPRDLPDLLLELSSLDRALLAQGAASLEHSTHDATVGEHDAWWQAEGGDDGGDGGGGNGEEAGDGAAGLVALWLQAWLQQCQEKLPRFTAQGTAAVLLAVHRAGVRPAAAWLEAAADALGAKRDVLSPSDLAVALQALAALRYTPDAQLLACLLDSCSTKLSLLADSELVGMAAALAQMDCQPGGVWLTAFMSEALKRLGGATRQATAASAAAVASAEGGSSSSRGSSGSDSDTGDALELEAVGGPVRAIAPWWRSGGSDGGRRARGLPPALLVDLLVAVAKLEARLSDPWVSAFFAAMGPVQLAQLDGERLGKLMWAVAILDISPNDPWVAAMMAQVRARLGEAPAGSSSAAASRVLLAALDGRARGSSEGRARGKSGPRRR